MGMYKRQGFLVYFFVELILRHKSEREREINESDFFLKRERVILKEKYRKSTREKEGNHSNKIRQNPSKIRVEFINLATTCICLAGHCAGCRGYVIHICQV